MRQSTFPIRTLKESPKDEKALNAILLRRGGFIDRVGAGIYSYFPLGLRVLNHISRVVREEMNRIGGVEILMPALHPKEYWQKTGRWNEVDVLYKIKARGEREYALGPTHEEIVVPLAKKLIQSYRDLPLYLYQVQVKFRDEPRAKSGLLRSREFLMKDLYSFHKDVKDLEEHYEKISQAYKRVFSRLELKAIRAEASGGIFSQFSHEFQVATPAGEDIIFYCSSCQFARNREIMPERGFCPNCKKDLTELKTAETGNIFKLGTKFSDSFDLSYRDETGKNSKIFMGCYGIGISRLMGTIAEVHHDKTGIIWPEEVAPFAVHLLGFRVQNAVFRGEIEKYYKNFLRRNIEVLYDDRKEVSDGQKLMEADLLGIPWRIIISERTMKEGKIEVKRRSESRPSLMDVKKFITSELRITN